MFPQERLPSSDPVVRPSKNGHKYSTSTEILEVREISLEGLKIYRLENSLKSRLDSSTSEDIRIGELFCYGEKTITIQTCH